MKEGGKYEKRGERETKTGERSGNGVGGGEGEQFKRGSDARWGKKDEELREKEQTSQARGSREGGKAAGKERKVRNRASKTF